MDATVARQLKILSRCCSMFNELVGEAHTRAHGRKEIAEPLGNVNNL